MLSGRLTERHRELRLVRLGLEQLVLINAIYIETWISFFYGYPIHCKLVSTIPGLHPLEATSIPLLDNQGSLGIPCGPWDSEVSHWEPLIDL